jgi:hypothetical protein
MSLMDECCKPSGIIISWCPGQFVDMKWKTLPLASIMSRPLVDNGSTEAARFVFDGGAAEINEVRSSPVTSLLSSILGVRGARRLS